MSASVPKGEAFFIDSVRACRDGAPPQLVADINAFIRQEATHSREHVAFNRRVADAGYDISRLEQRMEDRVTEIRTHGAVECLNSTMRSEEHTSELQSLMRISYAVFCLKQKRITSAKQTTYLHPTLQSRTEYAHSEVKS